METDIAEKTMNKKEDAIINDTPESDASTFTNLPAEIILNVLSNLSPVDLMSMSLTCRKLLEKSDDELLWKPFVLENLPSGILLSPSPCQNYRELYWSHDPHWFILKHRVWFSDLYPQGKLVLTRFDQRNGNIDGFRIVASSPFEIWNASSWERHPAVAVMNFRPTFEVYRETPDISIPPSRAVSGNAYEDKQAESIETPGSNSCVSRYISMAASGFEDLQDYYLCLSQSEREESEKSESTWPPRKIPAPLRTLNTVSESEALTADEEKQLLSATSGSGLNFTPKEIFPKPGSREEVCTYAFRVQQQEELNIQRQRTLRWSKNAERNLFSLPNFQFPHWARSGPPVWSSLALSQSDYLHHYGAIDSDTYIPTDQYPFRGIWVGDYNAHGCEFLLLKQMENSAEVENSSKDNENFNAKTLELPVRRENETDPEFKARLWEYTLSNVSGRLEAIKLTGDENVPRGEISFFAKDISEVDIDGVVGEDEFETLREEGEIFGKGRLVRSMGHIAESGFRSDMFLETQLILLSRDLIAQHWISFQQISFYRRVDIDRLMEQIESG